MEKNWEKIGYVLAGKYRIQVLLSLNERPMTPKEISRRTNLYLSHVSLTIKELTKSGLVECLTPNLRRGRIYSLTSMGKSIATEVNEREHGKEG
jgi:predicted transcriptional regulator